MERRLAVILAADMVGCTSLLEADQERGVRTAYWSPFPNGVIPPAAE